MLYNDMIPLCSDIRTERINTLCGKNGGLFKCQNLWYMDCKLGLKGLTRNSK